MPRYIDYAKLKEKVRIMDIAHRYDWPLTNVSNTWIGDCPICGSGRSDSKKFKITPRNEGSPDKWNCFGECPGGNSLDLVSLVEGCNVREASLLIADWFDVSDCDMNRSPSKKKGSGKSKQRVVQESTPQDVATEDDYVGDDSELSVEEEEVVRRHNQPLSFELKGLDPGHDAVVDSWMEGVAEHFGAGYCSKGIMQGRLAVPVHDADEQLVAYCGVALDDRKDRLKWPSADKYDPTLDLYNVHRASRTELGRSEGLVLVEDILDVFHLHMTGNDNAVATMGGLLSPDQAVTLLQKCGSSRKITILWSSDSDAYSFVRSLSAFSWVRVIEIHQGKNVRGLSADDIHAYLT